MTIGQTISAARKKVGLSQKDLAARVKKEDGTPISPPYLNDIERDRRNPPSAHLLREFATALNISFEYLLFLAGELPADVLEGTHTPEAVEAAFQAFRKALKEDKAPYDA